MFGGEETRWPERAVERGVLVSVQGRDSLKLKTIGRPFHISDAGTTCISASGILLDAANGIVLTTGTLLAPFLDVISPHPTLKPGCVIAVLLEEEDNTPSSSSSLNWRQASLLKIVRCESVKRVLQELAIPNWIVGWPRNMDDIGKLDLEKAKKLADTFWSGFEDIAVLQLSSPPRMHSMHSIRLSKAPLRRGMRVFTVGSPFGIISPRVFHNCCYSALVSNVITLQNHPQDAAPLFMMDTTCLPGTEGGPVFDSLGNLVGMLAPPIRSTDSNIEVQLALPAGIIIHELEKALPHIARSVLKPASIYHEKMLGAVRMNVLESVVLISLGAFWGSGVLVSRQGHVITSAHVIKPLLSNDSTPTHPLLSPGYNVEVRIDTYRENESVSQRWASARLIYVSNSSLDVALLQIINASEFPLNPLPSMRDFSEKSYTTPMPGDKVYAIGYSLFGPRKKLKATCTEGIISGLVHENGKVQIIHTSATVHKGASGGAIIDTRNNFIGLITCNTSTSTGSIIPTINFSIPVHLLRPIFEYISTGDPACFEKLTVSEKVSELWTIPSTVGLPSVQQEKPRNITKIDDTDPSHRKELAPGFKAFASQHLATTPHSPLLSKL